jgi:type II secretory pathway predicted ATPase ExeA
MYRHRFGLSHHPMPKNAQGKTFFEHSAGYRRLARRFEQFARDPGLGVFTGDAGVGKTAAIRNLCSALPQPDYRVTYICDTAVSPLDLYRSLAVDLGVKPSHRRAELWTDVKKALTHLVDERGVTPVVIIDEAQHLSDRFLGDLSGFLNFAFDSRDLFTLWLVGLPPLAQHLRQQQHAPLAMRVAARVHLEPLTREAFSGMITHGLEAAGATQKVLSDPALELLFRTSRGIPRLAAKLLRASMQQADERGQSFVDEHILEEVLDEMAPAIT